MGGGGHNALDCGVGNLPFNRTWLDVGVASYRDWRVLSIGYTWATCRLERGGGIK